MDNQPAIQNLDYIRQLIRDTRLPMDDVMRLRMIQGTGMGLDAMTTKKGDE